MQSKTVSMVLNLFPVRDSYLQLRNIFSKNWLIFEKYSKYYLLGTISNAIFSHFQCNVSTNIIWKVAVI